MTLLLVLENNLQNLALCSVETSVKGLTRLSENIQLHEWNSQYFPVTFKILKFLKLTNAY